MSDSLQPHGQQYANSWSLLKLMSIALVMPSNQLILCYPLLLLPLIFPSSRVFWVSSLHQVAKVLEFQHQSFQWIFRTDFLQDWMAWSPCSPRDSQEHSPTPQFEPSIFQYQEAKGPKYIYSLMDIVSLRTWSISWLKLWKQNRNEAQHTHGKQFRAAFSILNIVPNDDLYVTSRCQYDVGLARPGIYTMSAHRLQGPRNKGQA